MMVGCEALYVCVFRLLTLGIKFASVESLAQMLSASANTGVAWSLAITLCVVASNGKIKKEIRQQLPRRE